MNSDSQLSSERIEIIMGYSLRVKPYLLLRNRYWTDNDYRASRLNQDSRYMLSADETGWPTVEGKIFGDLISQAAKDANWEYDAEKFLDANYLLPSVPAQWLKTGVEAASVCLIAISVSKSAIDTGGYFDKTDNDIHILIEWDWSLLGYDVVNNHLDSALACVRYTEEDRKASLKKYGDNLNGCNLFEDYVTAEDFLEIANNDISEHAPFFVASIWARPECLEAAEPAG